jgi:hypothetical protein
MGAKLRHDEPMSLAGQTNTMQKQKASTNQIRASRITLCDAAGHPTIVLDGGADGLASIVMISPAGVSLQLRAQPEGGVVLSFDAGFSGAVTLSANGMMIRAADGRLGIAIGRVFDGTDAITVFEDGQPVWRAPANAPKRRRKRAHHPK